MFQQYDANNLTVDFADKTFEKSNWDDNFQLDLGDVSSPSWFFNNKRRIIKMWLVAVTLICALRERVKGKLSVMDLRIS